VLPDAEVEVVGVVVVVVVPDDVEDEDDPEEVGELEDPEAAAGVVVLVVLVEAVIAFDPPHPVMAKAATVSVPMAQNPFRFNCIRGPFRRWGADSQAKLGEHLLWMYPASVLSELQNSP
jgi:hypothetical protein